ncbi:MAG TPA: serine/threonine-protein kinase [Labilithrix sp.]
MNQALPSPYPSPGEVIDGKYRIDKILGEGGMGCVARAYHTVLRAPVALKFMNPQFMTFPGAVDRFINEGIASKRIRSDHVVPVDDVGKLSTGAPYLVMPCLEGMDLADLVARDGEPGLPTPRAVHFTLQILRGLQAAHAAGIIHRDMKPSNCFVVKHDGEPDFVKILDFGISKVAQPGSASLTQTNSALGTPLYMSPEQARSPRDVDLRSDLYSVGVILYELLTGHTPFFSESGEFTEILFKLFTAEPPPVQSTRPDLPDALAEKVHRALAREPTARFSTAGEMAEALFPFADERSRQVIARIRTFKPEQAYSMPPPADMPLPPSMVAFSNLDAKPATDVMANRPTTDIQKNAPFTAVMENAPGRAVVIHTPHSPQTPVSIANDKPDVSAAIASTQYDATGKHAPAVRTDLGATRDTAQPTVPPKRSPWVFVLPALAALGIGFGGFAIVNGKGQTPATKDTSTVSNATPPPPPVSVVPPASNEIAPTPTPSASVSASAKTAPPKPPPRNVNTNQSSNNALETQPHF